VWALEGCFSFFVGKLMEGGVFGLLGRVVGGGVVGWLGGPELLRGGGSIERY